MDELFGDMSIAAVEEEIEFSEGDYDEHNKENIPPAPAPSPRTKSRGLRKKARKLLRAPSGAAKRLRAV